MPQTVSQDDAHELLEARADNVEPGDILVDEEGRMRVEHIYQRGERVGFIRARRPVHRLQNPSGWAARCEHVELVMATRCNRHGFPLAWCEGRAGGYKRPRWFVADCQVTKRDEACECPPPRST